MSVYQINENILALSLLPVDKRQPILSAYITDLLSQSQYLNDKDMVFIYGATFGYYATASSYGNGDRVIGGLYYNNATFQSITASNINNSLTDLNYWEPFSDNFIGVSERYNFTAQHVTFEYALNRWFNTTFRQPTGVTAWGVRSDIYIDDNSSAMGPFLMGPDDDYSSTMGYDTSSAFMSPDAPYDPGFVFFPTNYTIWVPAAVFATFPGGTSSVTGFADKYNYAGISYTVATY